MSRFQLHVTDTWHLREYRIIFRSECDLIATEFIRRLSIPRPTLNAGSNLPLSPNISFAYQRATLQSYTFTSLPRVSSFTARTNHADLGESPEARVYFKGKRKERKVPVPHWWSTVFQSRSIIRDVSHSQWYANTAVIRDS